MNQAELAERLARIRDEVDRAAVLAGRDPAEITLLAATKTRSDETIRAAIQAGVTVCGENRVQELVAHLASGAYGDARVDFIGHLQTNKVKDVVGRVELIHSVSSEKLLLAIQRQAEKLSLVQDILLEINLAGEPTKSGFSPEEAPAAARLAAELPHVRLRGTMCIPPRATHSGDSRIFFAGLRRLTVDIIQKMSDNVVYPPILSMGMSGDYADAVLEGATIIRLGSALFGPRG